jgi:minor capsid protein
VILDDLGTLLQTAGVGVLGSTLFLGSMPPDTVATPNAELVAVIPIPGMPSVHSLADQVATFQQPFYQVLVRSTPYGFAAAMQRAEAAFVVLDGLHNVTVGQTYVLWIVALRSPYALRQDDAARFYLAFDVRCAVRSV